MKQEDISALKEILESESPEVYKALTERDGVMKEMGEMPVTQAIKVYTRRRNHLAEKGNEEGARQLAGLLKNLGSMPNTNIQLVSVYFDNGGYTVFVSSKRVLGVYNLDTNTTEAIAFLERAKESGSSYPKLYRLSKGIVEGVIE